MISPVEEAFRGRRVFVTGHTGFKGAWLTLGLHHLGAAVTGYALAAAADSMYARLELDALCTSTIGDIRDRAALEKAVGDAQPEVVIHMAAQSLVLPSYEDPLGTLETNVIGTANVLDVLRRRNDPCTVIVVTSDKCYENRGSLYGYRETDPLGGADVYSMSKAAAELVTSSYRRSFFRDGTVKIASARAGNVIGGGDRAEGRIVPDCIRALEKKSPISVRNPDYIRPWQHVLEPLSGYLLLAARMLQGDASVSEAWNFGPRQEDARTVSELVEAILREWGDGQWTHTAAKQKPESHTLRLSIEKAAALLGWQPRWSFERAVRETVAWYRADAGRKSAGPASAEVLRALTLKQWAAYGEGAS